MSSFQQIFDGRPDDWEFSRRSGDTVPDEDGIERDVDPGVRSILGGKWVDDHFEQSDDFVGLVLGDEETQQDLNLAVTLSGDTLAQAYGLLGLRMTRGGFSGQVQYVFDEYPDVATRFFVMRSAAGYVLEMSVYPNGDIGCRFEDTFTIITPTASLDVDVRVRYSAGSSLTTWVNGVRTDQPDPPMLRAAPDSYIAGYSDHTSGLGYLRNVRWDDQPRPFSTIESWPRV